MKQVIGKIFLILAVIALLWSALAASFLYFWQLWVLETSQIAFLFLILGTLALLWDFLAKKWPKFPFFEAGLVIFYLALSLYIWWPFFVSGQLIGFRADWALDGISINQLWQNLSSAWNRGGFGQPINYATSSLISLITLIGGKLISIFYFQRVYLFALLAIAGIASFYLARRLQLPRSIAFITSLFYVLTPVVSNKFVAGHLSYILAYALAPVIVGLFLKGEGKKLINPWIIGAGLLYALSGAQIQFFVMDIILLFFFAIFYRENRKSAFAQIGIIVVVAILIHCFWLLPLFLQNGQIGELSRQAATFSWLKGSSIRLNDALRLTGYFYDPGSTPHISSFWQVISALVPVFLVMVGVLSFKSDRNVRLFFLAALFGVFLAAGSYGPLSFVYSWAFAHIPLTTMFREIYHLMFLPAFFYAYLFGFCWLNLYQFVERYNWKIINLAHYILAAIMVLMISYGVAVFRPHLLANIETYKFPPVYQEAENFIQKDKEDFCILWLPMTQPIQYNNNEFAGIDPLIEYSPQPTPSQFEMENVAANPLRNYLEQELYKGENNNNIAQIMGLMNIKYVIWRADFETAYPYYSYVKYYPDIVPNWTQGNLKNRLDKDNNFQKVWEKDQVVIYQNKQYLPHIYPAIAQQHLADFTRIDSQTSNFTLVDSYQSEPAYTIQPGKMARESGNAALGWTSSLHWWWFNPMIAQNPDDGALTFASEKLEFSHSIKESGDYKLLVKIWQNPSGGEFDLNIGEKKFSINSYSKDFAYKWEEINTIKLNKGETKMSLQNYNNAVNLVSKIILAPEDKIGKNPDFSPISFPSQPEVNFEKVGLYKYKIKIKTDGPFWLVFSESYNPNWQLKLDGKKYGPEITNNFAQVYRIDQSGQLEGTLYYTPQRLLIFGYIISILSLLGCLFLIILPRFKYKK
jgi:hypothetical protein